MIVDRPQLPTKPEFLWKMIPEPREFIKKVPDHNLFRQRQRDDQKDRVHTIRQRILTKARLSAGLLKRPFCVDAEREIEEIVSKNKAAIVAKIEMEQGNNAPKPSLLAANRNMCEEFQTFALKELPYEERDGARFGKLAGLVKHRLAQNFEWYRENYSIFIESTVLLIAQKTALQHSQQASASGNT